MFQSFGRKVLFALVALALSTPLAAQELDPWTLSFEVEGGWHHPIRSFGKNTTGTDDADLIVLQPSAKADAAPMFGGALKLQLPNPSLSLRLSGLYLPDGKVVSRTPVCDVIPDFDPDAQDLRQLYGCDTPFEEDFTMTQVLARVQFKRVGDDVRLRPTIDLGLGVRRYDFAGQASCPSAVAFPERNFICTQADGLTANQTQPLITLGIGAQYAFDRFAPFAQVTYQISPYGGDAAGEEEAQNDAFMSAGVRVHIR